MQLSGRCAHASLLRIVVDDLEIGVLIESVETEHQSKAIGKRQLLVDRLSELDLAVLIEPNEAIVSGTFRQEVPTVATRLPSRAAFNSRYSDSPLSNDRSSQNRTKR